MHYRSFLITGKLTDRVDGSESGEFGCSDEEAAAEVAAVAGVDVSTVTVEHASTSPFGKHEITLPPQTFDAPPPTLEQKVDALIASLGVDAQATFTTALKSG